MLDEEVPPKPSYTKVWFGFIGMLASAAISLGFQRLSKGTADFQPADYQQIYLNTLLGFATIELAIILFQNTRFEHRFERQASRLKDLALSNSIQNKLTQTLLRAFDYNTPAHSAVTHSISRFLDTNDITETRITLENDQLAKEMYWNFWQEVLKVQNTRERPLSKKTHPSLTALMAHSGPVDSWETESYARSRQQQEEFCAANGILFRIIVGSGNSEDDPVYERVLTYMRNSDVKAFYVDRREAKIAGIHDYMLIAFGGEYYSLAWNPGLGISDDGVFSGCEINIGRQWFQEQSWVSWIELCSKLESWQPVRAVSEVLSQKPSSAELIQMRTQP